MRGIVRASAIGMPQLTEGDIIMRITRRNLVLGLSAASAFPPLLRAQSGADEVRIGTTCPLSGPGAVYGLIGVAMEAYFSQINDAGGINGRKIKLIVADDAYSPNRTLEQTRKLVESEKVLFMIGQVGSSTSLAARQYLNEAKVPQLFVGSGAPTWLDDIKHFPWSLPIIPSYADEGRTIAEHILTTRPKAKVGVLVQNDDAGRGFMRGIREVFASRPGTLVKERSYEAADPTVDSQVIDLHGSGADVLVCITLPRATSQAIRRSHDLNWKPQIYIVSNSTSIQQALAPAGLDRARGVIGTAVLKDLADSAWANDAGVQSMAALMKKYKPQAALEFPTALGLTVAALGAQVIRQCGYEVTRDNVLAQTMRLDMTPQLLLPGLTVKTSPDRRAVLTKVRLQEFDGAGWKLMSA
jgi:branched-chain amino acid transport system substrate-binding protein